MNPIELNAWLAKEILVHERALRGYLSRFFKDVADIEDVVQETYDRLLSMNDSASAGVRNWHAFLFTSARNVALDRIRRSRVVSLDTLVEMSGVDVDPQKDLTMKAMLIRILFAALDMSAVQPPAVLAAPSPKLLLELADLSNVAISPDGGLLAGTPKRNHFVSNGGSDSTCPLRRVVRLRSKLGRAELTPRWTRHGRFAVL